MKSNKLFFLKYFYNLKSTKLIFVIFFLLFFFFLYLYNTEAINYQCQSGYYAGSGKCCPYDRGGGDIRRVLTANAKICCKEEYLTPDRTICQFDGVPSSDAQPQEGGGTPPQPPQGGGTPPKPPEGDAASMVLSNDSRIVITLQAAEAAWVSEVFMSSPENLRIADNNLQNVGLVIKKKYKAGTKLNFFIRVQPPKDLPLSEGVTLTLSAYDRDAYSKYAKIETLGKNKWRIGFEDLPDDIADWDYNDVILLVESFEESKCSELDKEGKTKAECKSVPECPGTWAANKCCGDDEKENFCDGKLNGCFDEKFFKDPDLNQYVCETCAGAKWLNGRCCGDDGLEDTWNSNNATYGSSCYQGKVILTCGQPENNKAIVNENGSFSLCGLNTDPITNVNFASSERCDFKCSNTLFCSYTGNWQPNTEIGRSNASTWPLEATLKTECCNVGECWNGNACVENQKDAPTSLPIQGFRCIDEIWKESDIRIALDENSTGYCPEKTQCLVSLEGNAADNNNPDENPQCIANEQYIKDNYCENGIWTSRTKFLALRLLDMPKGDYAIFCDNAENTLNNLQYLIGENEAREYVGFQRANNFCVLNNNGKIIFGTSLNQEINAQNFPFLKVVGISSCTAALSYDDEQYHSCDSSNRIWYNKKTKSVIYSKETINLASINFFDNFINFLKNPFQTIANKLIGVKAPYDESFVKGLKRFEKLYTKKSGTKFILGSIEGKNFKNLLIEYRNFETNICNFIDTYNNANKDFVSGLLCKKDGSIYYVLGQGSSFTTLDPEKIWQDLTSKLKIN